VLTLLQLKVIHRPNGGHGRFTFAVQAASCMALSSLEPVIIRTATTRKRRVSGDGLLATALLLPNVALLAWFTYRPLIQSFRLSLVRWDFISPTKANVGLSNYTNWWHDPVSRHAMQNTAVFTASTVILLITFGLVFATALNDKRRSSRIASAALFAPYIVPGSVVAIGWYFIFDPKFGLLAAALNVFGIDSPNWYNRPGYAMAMVVTVHVWKYLGYTCVLYLAGLQAIPPELFEAAEVDGAGWYARLRHVVLPGVRPTTLFVGVTSFLSSMQAFDLIYVMTQGGPLDGTRTLSFQIYDEAFVRFRVGTASAVSTVLFVILLAVTIVQIRVMRQRS
jgi:sn-glycerol 3-phosphate transport system permease protein